MLFFFISIIHVLQLQLQRSTFLFDHLFFLPPLIQFIRIKGWVNDLFLTKLLVAFCSVLFCSFLLACHRLPVIFISYAAVRYCNIRIYVPACVSEPLCVGVSFFLPCCATRRDTELRCAAALRCVGLLFSALLPALVDWTKRMLGSFACACDPCVPPFLLCASVLGVLGLSGV